MEARPIAESHSNDEISPGYWDIRGLAQPTRMLAAYLKAPLKDELYAVGEAPEYNRDSWLSVKPTLGLDFPNLPYLIDGALFNSSCVVMSLMGLN